MLLFFALLMGNLISSGALQYIRTVDVVKLVAAGAILGVMVVTIATHFKNKKSEG